MPMPARRQLLPSGVPTITVVNSKRSKSFTECATCLSLTLTSPFYSRRAQSEAGGCSYKLLM